MNLRSTLELRRSYGCLKGCLVRPVCFLITLLSAVNSFSRTIFCYLCIYIYICMYIALHELSLVCLYTYPLRAEESPEISRIAV